MSKCKHNYYYECIIVKIDHQLDVEPEHLENLVGKNRYVVYFMKTRNLRIKSNSLKTIFNHRQGRCVHAFCQLQLSLLIGLLHRRLPAYIKIRTTEVAVLTNFANIINMPAHLTNAVQT